MVREEDKTFADGLDHPLGGDRCPAYLIDISTVLFQRPGGVLCIFRSKLL